MKERKFIEQGMKKIQLEQYLKKQLSRAGFTGLHMVKTPLVTRIVLTVARPGLAIGKGGQNIRQITDDVEKNFGIDNPQIEIQDIKVPALDSKATVEKMVELVERGYSWKSVAFRTLREIMEAGAQGVELVLKGKLSGKGGRKRKHRAVQGYMKKVGDQVKLVDTAKASAYPKAGAIGIKLSIIGPDVVFPDKVRIGEALKEKEASGEEAGKEEKEGREKGEEEKPGKEGTEEKPVKEKKEGKSEAKQEEKSKEEEKSLKEGKEKKPEKKEKEQKDKEEKKPEESKREGKGEGHRKEGKAAKESKEKHGKKAGHGDKKEKHEKAEKKGEKKSEGKAGKKQDKKK